MSIHPSEPITVAGVVAPEGAHVLSLADWLKERKKRNRPPKTRVELEAALDASDRIHAISTHIRRRHKLPPLPESRSARAWRAALDKTTQPPAQSLTERAEALAKARAKVEREQRRLDVKTREIALEAKQERMVSKVSSVLGLSRQRLYQLT